MPLHRRIGWFLLLLLVTGVLIVGAVAIYFALGGDLFPDNWEGTKPD